jgi:hypothetical protein
MTQLSLTEATQFMNELFAIWTETDHASRRAAIEAHYHPDIRFRNAVRGAGRVCAETAELEA